MRKVLLYFFFFLLLNGKLNAQGTIRDSLLHALATAKEDTSKVFLYIQIGNAIEDEGEDILVAGNYYQLAGDLSKKLSYKKGILKYISNYTQILNITGKLDSALLLSKQAVEIATELNDKLVLAKVHGNLGNSFNYLNDLDNAMLEYQKALKLFEELNEEYFVARMQDLLQLVFWKLKIFEKGIYYGTAAVNYFRKENKQQELAMALLNLANNYQSFQKKDLGLNQYTEALNISKEIGFKRGELTSLLGIGDIYYHRFDMAKAKPYYENALSISREIHDVEGETIANRGLAMCHLMSKEYNAAENNINKSLAIAQKAGLQKEVISSMEMKSSILYTRQDVINAERYLDSANQVRDKLFGEEIRNKTIELDKKYETEKKESQIKLQQTQLKQKNILNYFLIGGAVALLIILVLSYRNYKHSQKLQQAKIDELETEKQLSATEAVLKGEEQERIRLAKDLHDGLGGMLSGIKYSLSNMKENLIMTPDNAQAFERSIDMLDSSIKEMRRVAHNMMPEMLLKYGLDIALKAFCAEIDRSGVIHAIYQSIDMEKAPIEQTAAVTIYRVVQELVNNVIKHAGAKNVLVQAHLSVQERLLAVTVEDDGGGFDTTLLKDGKGIGWGNIKNRLDFLRGKFDVNSEPGKGTSVLIEINI